MAKLKGYIHIPPYYYNIDHIVKVGENKIFLDNGVTVSISSDINDVIKAINRAKEDSFIPQDIIHQTLKDIKLDIKCLLEEIKVIIKYKVRI